LLKGESFRDGGDRFDAFLGFSVNGSSLREIFRPFAKNKLLSPVLEDAYKMPGW